MKKLFEKKLGACYLVEFSHDNDYYYIQLYKKWAKFEGYEATDYSLKFPIKESEKALSIYDGINLKTMYDVFKN